MVSFRRRIVAPFNARRAAEIAIAARITRALARHNISRAVRRSPLLRRIRNQRRVASTISSRRRSRSYGNVSMHRRSRR